MKKVISILLVFAMVLSLYGCGKKELTDEEKAEIYNEVKAKLEVETEENNNTEEANGDKKVQEDKYGRFVLTECSAEDVISVEDVRFEVTRNRVYVQVKIRNLTGEDASNMFVNFQTIDENGDVIDSTGNGVQRLDNGQADWFPFLTSSDYATVEEYQEQVKAIEIYFMLYCVGTDPKQYQFSFTDPIVINPMDITEIHN